MRNSTVRLFIVGTLSLAWLSSARDAVADRFSTVICIGDLGQGMCSPPDHSYDCSFAKGAGSRRLGSPQGEIAAADFCVRRRASVIIVTPLEGYQSGPDCGFIRFAVTCSN
jgi:hypothetical protein